MMTLSKWLSFFYAKKPDQAKRIVSGYAVLAQQKDVLADIAHRGGVYTYEPVKGMTPYEAGVFEGRRQFALEMLCASNADFQALYRLFDNPNR